jgi:hypothetical protein
MQLQLAVSSQRADSQLKRWDTLLAAMVEGERIARHVAVLSSIPHHHHFAATACTTTHFPIHHGHFN